MYQVDGAHMERSNWLRWLNCPRTAAEENVISMYCYGKVFYRTMRDVSEGEELLVYYGDAYAKHLGIDHTLFKHHQLESSDDGGAGTCCSPCQCGCPKP